jgi:hypothetical protein
MLNCGLTLPVSDSRIEIQEIFKTHCEVTTSRVFHVTCHIVFHMINNHTMSTCAPATCFRVSSLAVHSYYSSFEKTASSLGLRTRSYWLILAYFDPELRQLTMIIVLILVLVDIGACTFTP